MAVDTHKVEVVRITLEPHGNADSLEVARIFGFTCCVQKGAFVDGQLAAYIQPDSVVDSYRPEFAFLTGHERIRVKRLRGVVSMGLLLPVPDGVQEGDDLAEYFGVMHYEPPLPGSSCGEVEGGPVGIYSPKYDIESMYRYKHLFVPGEEVIATEKIHGANSRFVFAQDEDRMYCGSRSEWKKKSDSNLWWQALAKHPWIEEYCRSNPNDVLYGEVFGNVQSLRYGAKPSDVFFRAFDVLRAGEWLDFDEWANSLPADGVAPLVYRGPFNFEELIALSDGSSLIPTANHIREGIVGSVLIWILGLACCYGLLPTEILMTSDSPFVTSTLGWMFSSDIGLVNEAIAFRIPPASLTAIGQDAGGMACNSSALIAQPTSTLTPFKVPIVTRYSSPNTFIPITGAGSGATRFHPALCKAASICFRKSTDSGSAAAIENVYSVPGNARRADKVSAEIVSVRGALILASSRFALAASAIAPATCAWACAADSFAFAMLRRNPSALALASAECCSAIERLAWAFFARSFASADPSWASAMRASASFARATKTAFLASESDCTLAIWRVLPSESAFARRSFSTIIASCIPDSSVFLRLATNCVIKTPTAKTTVRATKIIYQRFQKVTARPTSWARVVRRAISDNFSPLSFACSAIMLSAAGTLSVVTYRCITKTVDKP